MKTFKLICSKVILRSGLKKKYIPAGEYLKSLSREIQVLRGIFFLSTAYCLVLRKEWRFKEIENDAYDLVEPEACCRCGSSRQQASGSQDRKASWFQFLESQISLKTFKLICSKVILRSGLKKKYIPAGEYLNLSLERERFKYCRDIFFLKHCLLSSVKERMAIQEIENDAYDLVNPEACCRCGSGRQQASGSRS